MIATIAFIIAVYHMTNHSLYKALLFMSAASVDTTVSVRDIDRLGGLIKRMPWTAFFFLIGAMSLVALPPFNGFVSEWLTLPDLIRSAELSSTGDQDCLRAVRRGLALTTALAVNCFVKAFAMSFLGIGRSSEVTQAREAPRSMVAPMAVLAALCLLLGVLPTYVIPVLDEVIAPLTGAKAVDALVPPFFAGNVGQTTAEGVCSGIPRVGRASWAGGFAGTWLGRDAPRRRAQPGRVCHVHILLSRDVASPSGGSILCKAPHQGKNRGEGSGLEWWSATPHAGNDLHSDRIFKSGSGNI